MNGERRNDIGVKVLLGVLALVVTSIMSFAIASSGKANEKANNNQISIKGIQVEIQIEQRYTREAIQDIKGDIREIKQAVIK